MATVRPPRKGPMHRQRISENSFWAYCCAEEGTPAAETARTPANNKFSARKRIRSPPRSAGENNVRTPAPQCLLCSHNGNRRIAALSAKLDAFYRASEDQTVTTPAKPMPSVTRSDEVVAKHKKYLWPSVTNYYQRPLVADRGEMQYLWDLEGRKYLDFFGGILTVSVGHCNPKVTSKINAQVNRLQHTSTLYPNEHIVALAEKIAQIT